MIRDATLALEPTVAHPAQRRWRHVLAVGALWGLAASVMESVVLPVGDGHWSTFWRLVLWNIPILTLMGMCLAVVIEFAGARPDRPVMLAGVVIGGALALSAAWSGVLSVSDASGLAAGIETIFPEGRDPLASYLYQAWVIIFYGGLYVVAWTLNQRAERTRQAFDQAKIARVRTETLLGEARLQSLRGHVEPQFLLRVMSEVARRYSSMPESADRLVGLLVGFLRLAMPGVRNGRSTLADEINLARAYVDLLADLEPYRSQCKVVAPSPIPELPFPPLLLLPLLDRMAATSSEGDRRRMLLTVNDRGVALAFEGDGIAPVDLLSPALSYRIGVGLSTLFGHGWTLSPRAPGVTHGPALVLAVDAAPCPGGTTMGG